MEEFIATWGTAIREVSVGGFAIYALVKVWQRLLSMSDRHRLDSQEKDAAHRLELKEQGDLHRQEMRDQEDRHREVMQNVVSRNMDEHRERNRINTKMVMATAHAFAVNGQKAPDPYPSIDDMGRTDPRD